MQEMRPYKIILGKQHDNNSKIAVKGNYYVCSMIKDEQSYIREWALYNRSIGFDKIVLYDDNSTKPYDNVIGDLIKEGFVEIRKWEGEQWQRQTKAFNDFVWSGDWGEEDYCAFIDVDEFIVFDKVKTVAEFMEFYKEFAGVGLSWRLFNANGRIEAPRGISTFEAYTSEFEYIEPRIKVIGRLKDILTFPTVHYFVPNKGRLVTTNNQTINGMNVEYCDYTNGHINHYITKSWQDWVKRLKRGNMTKGLRKVETFFEYNPDMLYLKDELTKNLNYDEFPTIRGEEEQQNEK